MSSFHIMATMGDTRTKFYLDELSKCVARNEEIGEFVPVCGTFVLDRNDPPCNYAARKYKPLAYYLDYLGRFSYEVCHGFKEEYAKVIRETLAQVEASEGSPTHSGPDPFKLFDGSLQKMNQMHHIEVVFSGK